MVALINGLLTSTCARLLLEKLNARSERRLLPSLLETIDTLNKLYFSMQA
jgi:hypothetical protein